jgi:hypothetical protein
VAPTKDGRLALLYAMHKSHLVLLESKRSAGFFSETPLLFPDSLNHFEAFSTASLNDRCDLLFLSGNVAAVDGVGAAAGRSAAAGLGSFASAATADSSGRAFGPNLAGGAAGLGGSRRNYGVGFYDDSQHDHGHGSTPVSLEAWIFRLEPGSESASPPPRAQPAPAAATSRPPNQQQQQQTTRPSLAGFFQRQRAGSSATAAAAASNSSSGAAGASSPEGYTAATAGERRLIPLIRLATSVPTDRFLSVAALTVRFVNPFFAIRYQCISTMVAPDSKSPREPFYECAVDAVPIPLAASYPQFGFFAQNGKGVGESSSSGNSAVGGSSSGVGGSSSGKRDNGSVFKRLFSRSGESKPGQGAATAAGGAGFVFAPTPNVTPHAIAALPAAGVGAAGTQQRRYRWVDAVDGNPSLFVAVRELDSGRGPLDMAICVEHIVTPGWAGDSTHGYGAYSFGPAGDRNVDPSHDWTRGDSAFVFGLDRLAPPPAGPIYIETLCSFSFNRAMLTTDDNFRELRAFPLFDPARDERFYTLPEALTDAKDKKAQTAATLPKSVLGIVLCLRERRRRRSVKEHSGGHTGGGGAGAKERDGRDKPGRVNVGPAGTCAALQVPGSIPHWVGGDGGTTVGGSEKFRVGDRQFLSCRGAAVCVQAMPGEIHVTGGPEATSHRRSIRLSRRQNADTMTADGGSSLLGGQHVALSPAGDATAVTRLTSDGPNATVETPAFALPVQDACAGRKNVGSGAFTQWQTPLELPVSTSGNMRLVTFLNRHVREPGTQHHPGSAHHPGAAAHIGPGAPSAGPGAGKGDAYQHFVSRRERVIRLSYRATSHNLPAVAYLREARLLVVIVPEENRMHFFDLATGTGPEYAFTSPLPFVVGHNLGELRIFEVGASQPLVVNRPGGAIQPALHHHQHAVPQGQAEQLVVAWAGGAILLALDRQGIRCVAGDMILRLGMRDAALARDVERQAAYCFYVASRLRLQQQNMSAEAQVSSAASEVVDALAAGLLTRIHYINDLPQLLLRLREAELRVEAAQRMQSAQTRPPLLDTPRAVMSPLHAGGKYDTCIALLPLQTWPGGNVLRYNCNPQFVSDLLAPYFAPGMRVRPMPHVVAQVAQPRRSSRRSCAPSEAGGAAPSMTPTMVHRHRSGGTAVGANANDVATQLGGYSSVGRDAVVVLQPPYMVGAPVRRIANVTTEGVAAHSAVIKYIESVSAELIARSNTVAARTAQSLFPGKLPEILFPLPMQFSLPDTGCTSVHAWPLLQSLQSSLRRLHVTRAAWRQRHAAQVAAATAAAATATRDASPSLSRIVTSTQPLADADALLDDDEVYDRSASPAGMREAGPFPPSRAPAASESTTEASSASPTSTPAAVAPGQDAGGAGATAGAPPGSGHFSPEPVNASMIRRGTSSMVFQARSSTLTTTGFESSATMGREGDFSASATFVLQQRSGSFNVTSTTGRAHPAGAADGGVERSASPRRPRPLRADGLPSLVATLTPVDPPLQTTLLTLEAAACAAAEAPLQGGTWAPDPVDSVFAGLGVGPALDRSECTGRWNPWAPLQHPAAVAAQLKDHANSPLRAAVRRAAGEALDTTFGSGMRASATIGSYDDCDATLIAPLAALAPAVYASAAGLHLIGNVTARASLPPSAMARFMRFGIVQGEDPEYECMSALASCPQRMTRTVSIDLLDQGIHGLVNRHLRSRRF